MSWLGIVTALFNLFGPIIAEWLKKWLDSLFTKVAADMPDVATFGSEKDAQIALLDRAIERTRRPLRRALLRGMRRQVEAGTLDLDELRDIAAANNNDD